MTNTTNCIRYEGDLKAYADGELSWLRRRAIRRHLTHCASCQKEIQEMTQITEDLRAAEPADALSPSLREKLLSPPAPSVRSQSKEEQLGNEGTSAPSPAPQTWGGGAAFRKRPILAWGLAATFLIAWFFSYSITQRNIVNSSHQNRVLTADSHAPKSAQTSLSMPQYADQSASMSARVMPSPKTKPVPPPPFTVRLSDREAGAADGNVHVQIINPNRHFSGSAGNAVRAQPDTDLDTLRQVHKEASIGIQVPNPEATGNMLNQMVKESGGYVAANNLSTGDDGLKSGELIVRVPEPQFETFLAAVAKLGVVQSKNVTGEDITETTSDADQIEGVLEEDVQQSEVRLKDLGSRAKWHDEQATRDLRIQLAQAQARLVLLKRMAALGAITIDLSQTPKAVPPPPVTNGFTGSLKATTHDAMLSLVGSAGALLALIIWLLAYAPVWVPLLLLGRYVLKEYRKREAV